LTRGFGSDKIIAIMTTASASTPSTPATTTTTTSAPERTPVVEFEYPDSTTGEMKVRYLRVVEADARYVKGYELVSPLSKTDGQFKSFLRTRLARNGVALVSF
jgi:hypothetical protein